MIWAGRLAAIALFLPVIVFSAIAAHTAWFYLTDRLAPLEAIHEATMLVHLTVTPSGTTLRQGPGSHLGVDTRYDPRVPLLQSTAPFRQSNGSRP